MHKLKTQPQVFVSFALPDRKVAQRISHALQASGINVTTMDELGTTREYSTGFRRAVENCDAVVLALGHVSDKHPLPASVLFEAGAAMGAGKPIFVVVEELTGKLPFNAPNLHVLPLSRLDEIAIKLEQ